MLATYAVGNSVGVMEDLMGGLVLACEAFTLATHLVREVQVKDIVRGLGGPGDRNVRTGLYAGRHVEGEGGHKRREDGKSAVTQKVTCSAQI
jgi:hypothetical protein